MWEERGIYRCFRIDVMLLKVSDGMVSVSENLRVTFPIGWTLLVVVKD